MISILKKHFYTLLLLFICLPSVYFLLLPGFYEPHDLHHIADIYQMFRAIGSGQFPPRWGPDFSFGFGYPLFNFYYLIPFYLGAFYFVIFQSLTFSFEAVFITSVFLSVFGMYKFLREFFDKFPSFVGATLFLYTPYRAVQIYVRGAVGEAMALSLLPLLLWAIYKLLNNNEGKRVIATTAFFGGLFILTHNYFWAIVLPFILFFIFLFIDRKKSNKQLPSLFISGLLAVGISAYWWLPALVEQKLVSSVTPFPLIDHFPFIKQLITPSWGYGSSVWGPGDEISFQIGLVNLVVFVVLLFLFLFKKKIFKEKLFKLTVWSLVGFLISMFLMNIRSYAIWKIIPFHDFIQFPWRLLSLTTFFTAVIAATFIQVYPKKQKLLGLIITFNFCIPLYRSYFLNF